MTPPPDHALPTGQPAPHPTERPLGPTPLWQDPRAIALLLAASLTTMANATISPALPGLAQLFADHPHAAFLTRLLVPAPSLGVILCAPLCGMALDMIGRRRILISGIGLFVLAGTAGLYLPDLTTLMVSRLVLGIAVAMIMTSQTALVGDYFTGATRNALTGLQISARNFGGFVFILLAGWGATVSPRLPFAIYGLAAVMLLFIWRAITEPPREATHEQPQNRPQGQTQTQTQTPGTTAQTGPAIAPDSARWWLSLTALCGLQMLTNMSFFLMPTQVPFYFEALGRDSAVMTGTILGTLTLTGGCTALLYGRLYRQLGHTGAFGLGYAAMGSGFFLMALPAISGAELAGAAAIGAGFALVMPNFVAIALRLAPAQRRGAAAGMLTTSVFLGQILSPLISMPLIATLGFTATFRTTGLALMMLALGAMFTRAMLRRIITDSGPQKATKSNE